MCVRRRNLCWWSSSAHGKILNRSRKTAKKSRHFLQTKWKTCECITIIRIYSSRSGGFDWAKRNQQTNATNNVFNLIFVCATHKYCHSKSVHISRELSRSNDLFVQLSQRWWWCGVKEQWWWGSMSSVFGNLHSLNTIMFVLIFIELVWCVCFGIECDGLDVCRHTSERKSLPS